MPDELSARVSRDPKRVYLVTGSARPLVLDTVATIEAAVLSGMVMPAFNHGSYRCTEGPPERMFEAAQTPPILAARRLVVVRELGEGSDAFYGGLEEYLGRSSPTTTLLLTGEALPKQEKGRPAWARKIPDLVRAAGGEVIEIDESRVDPVRFATDRAVTAGKRLDPAAARLLIETVGKDLDRLGNEVDKLAIYVGAAELIDVDAVRATCALLAEAEVWDLTAALATRDRAGAVTALYRLQAIDEEPRRVLSMIAWQVRQLIEAAELVRGGASDDVVQRATRMRWDTWKRVRPLLDQTPPAAELLRRLAKANFEMNSSRAGAERILDALVLEMVI